MDKNSAVVNKNRHIMANEKDILIKKTLKNGSKDNSINKTLMKSEQIFSDLVETLKEISEICPKSDSVKNLKQKYESLTRGLNEKQITTYFKNSLKEKQTEFEASESFTTLESYLVEHFGSEKKKSLANELEEKDEGFLNNNSAKSEDSSLSSDSVIDPKREVSSDSEEGYESTIDYSKIFDYDDQKPLKPKLLPIFQDMSRDHKPNEIVRYKIDEEFFDHWCNKSKMDQEKLDNMLKLWASDNWEGLYDPPIWLTADMFCMALINESSNKRKTKKLMEATAYLEIARLTSSKEMPNLKEQAISYLENSKPSFDWNESFEKQTKTIALFMYRMYINSKDLYEEQTTDCYKFKDDLLLAISNATQELREITTKHEKLTKTFAEKMKLLENVSMK